MGFYFATIAPVGHDPVPIDASNRTGIKFWAWNGMTAQHVLIQLVDKNETPGFNVCDSAATGATACGGAVAALTVAAGWQSMQIPFTQFVPILGYGGANETELDPTTLTTLEWQVQTAPGVDGGPQKATFDICVWDVSFY